MDHEHSPVDSPLSRTYIIREFHNSNTVRMCNGSCRQVGYNTILYEAWLTSITNSITRYSAEPSRSITPFGSNDVSLTSTCELIQTSKAYTSKTSRKQQNKCRNIDRQHQDTGNLNVHITLSMLARNLINHLKEQLQEDYSSVSKLVLSKILRNGLMIVSYVSAMHIPFQSSLLILASLPGVSAGCQIGIIEISQAAGAIVNQIPGQTLILSMGAAFGGNQSFASDFPLAIGLLPIGVAGINGIHEASKLFSNQEEFEIGVTANEIEDRPPGKREYAGLIARILRLYSTSVIFMVVGMMTCHIVFLGWFAILLLTTAIVAFGEAYAPLGVMITDVSNGALYSRWREDGTLASEWRYTLTPSGNIIIHSNSLQRNIITGRFGPAM
ncbi:hypothetical protein BGW37DRAFT_470984, partial [Umbelopsis sp. PMI_123]